ncbi:DUF7269 family protein [Halomicrobium salinisoli]|uniref:DUF7269 family protein n=1 Tax=Halomicrobium salinisoli TaxID=2878391 RepID=UPI001CF08264|nr:hypothetical protein [Halomicrobium salinisoli]
MRRLSLAVAVAAAALGLALAFVPGLRAVASAPDNLPSILGGGAVLAGLVRAWQWLRHEPRGTTLPERERGRPVEVPGSDFDASLALVPAVGASGGNRRVLRIRERLRETAVAVLVRYRGLSAAAAAERLAEGTWTDDPLAADFFATGDGSGGSVTESVAGSLWGEGPFKRRVRRAAAEIARIASTGDEE